VSSGRTNDQPERRASQRFSIDRKIRYRVMTRGHRDVSGSGKTVNMSSVGMLITTDQVLSPGWRVEVEVAGPFQVDDRVFLKQVITGRIVRSETGAVPLAALKISGHVFQTGGLRNNSKSTPR
jgi:hypothetical protein